MTKLVVPWRLAMAAVLAATGLVAAMPAAAEDNDDPDLYAYGCFDGLGVDRPEGSVVVSGTLGFPPVDGFVGPGQYMCIDGEWVWIGVVVGPGGVIFMEGAPSVTVADTAVSVAEGGTATTTGTVGSTDGAPIQLAASVGTVTAGPSGTWSWSYSPTDGPAQTQTVIVTATAGRRIGGTTFELTVGNVAPTVAAVTPISTRALVGEPVSFQATATDPSPDDTAAGFGWAFEGSAAADDTHTTSFSECGTKTVTATATDKDGASSTTETSAPVTVVEAKLAAPLRTASYNLVRAGQVVPLRLAVGCDGLSVGGLSPSLEVLSGDVDPATDAGGPTQSVAVTDASGADTGNTMRLAGDVYVYALRVPSAAAGSLFTVRIRPFGDDTVVSVVLQLRA